MWVWLKYEIKIIGLKNLSGNQNYRAGRIGAQINYHHAGRRPCALVEGAPWFGENKAIKTLSEMCYRQI